MEVTSEGGFINPAAQLGELPEVAVDTDGAIYTPDTGSESLPMVEPVSVRVVGPAGADEIQAAIRAAGLDQAHDCGIAADAGVTVFTVDIDGTQVVSRIAASGPGGPGHPGSNPAASPGCAAASSAAFDLLARLTDPNETWGASNVTSQRYAPVAYRIWFAPAGAADGSSGIAWPLADSLSTFGAPATPDFGVTGLRSAVVLGDDAQTLGAALGGGAQGEMVLADGQAYQFWVRALLPDELG
jgi:hypothetical protein